MGSESLIKVKFKFSCFKNSVSLGILVNPTFFTIIKRCHLDLNIGPMNSKSTMVAPRTPISKSDIENSNKLDQELLDL